MSVSTIDPNGLNIGQIGGRRNLLINSDFRIAQRGTSTTTLSGGYYTVDRWTHYVSAGAILEEQSTDAPSGFSHSFKNTMTTASSGAVWITQQKIEGYNTAHLNFGTSDAQDIVLSFWVKSSVTGKFSGHIGNDNAGGSYRVLVFNYTINSANTWEYKTVNIAGDTSGTWNTDQNTGLKVLFNLGTGGTTATANVWQTADAVRTTDSVGIEGTTNATWQITGVQLEVSPSGEPTPFEHRSYGEELSACQRYYTKFESASMNMHGFRYNSTISIAEASFPTTMRAAPTLTIGVGNGTLTANPSSTWGASMVFSGIDNNYVDNFTADAEL